MIERAPQMRPRKPAAILVGDRRDHPAVRAWTAATSLATLPECIHVRRRASSSAIYRLVGVGTGGTDVFAKRNLAQRSAIERTVYGEILPELPLVAPHYYGSHVEDPYEWIFVEDVGEDRYSPQEPQHLRAGARWIGTLHVGALRIAAARSLPDCSPARYLTHLRAARQKVTRYAHGDRSRPLAPRTLEAILSLCDDLEARWQRVEEGCAGAPATAVHGDFRRKNVRVRTRGSTLDVFPIDWETAGWGCPALDLLRIDLRAYWSVVREAWPHVTLDTVERIARMAEVLHWTAALNWECERLRPEFVASHNDAIEKLESVLARLTSAARANHVLEWPGGQGP